MQPNKEQSLKFRILSVIGTVLGFIIIVLLIIGGSLLASKEWNPSWNPFEPKPEYKNNLKAY